MKKVRKVDHCWVVEVVVIISIFWSYMVNLSSACLTEPLECTCTFAAEQLNTVECKDLGFLDIVPDFSSNDNIIQQLEIKGRTAFDTIQPRAFGNLKIRNLKLTGLSIINLTSCSFCGLGTHLESLYLDENGLSSLPNDIFHELVGLIYLHLDQNALTYINASHFDSLVNLQHLDLQGNLLSDIPGDSFRNLQSLVSLYLDNNNIEHINPGLFQNMPSLKILYLGPNAINNLSSTPFQPLQSMERLILRRNKITTIPETLLLYNNKLTHLELDYNNISVIPIGLFSSTANMEYIDMKFNKITSFHSTTFSNLVFLKYLFLCNNLLNTIPLNAFENLNKLQTLDLQNNNIQDLAYHNLIGLSNLKELYLQGNQLLVIQYGIFDPVTKLQILDLSKNKLQYAFHGPFDTLRNLERLHLSHNQLVSITKDWFQNLDRIKQLLLTNNKIREVEIGTFENLNFLLELDISDNHLLKVEDNLFNNLSNLDKLKLARNPLSNLTAKSFIGLRKLRELHLNNTCIGESVNSDSLKDMPNLEVLHMRHNDLILISSSLFQHQHSLKSLDIYNCKLNSIQHWESATSLQSLQIGENPLNCSCENAWLRQMYGISSDVLKLTCQDDHMGYYTVCFPQTNCTQFWNQTFQTLCSLNASTDDTVLDTTTEYVVEDICDPNRYVDTVTKSPGRTAPTQKILEEIVVYNLSVAQNYSYVSISWSVTDEYKNYISKFIIHLEFNDSSRMIDVQNPYHYIPVSELTMDVNYTVCVSVTLSSGRLLPFLSCKNVHMIQKTTTVYMSTVTANIISSTPTACLTEPLECTCTFAAEQLNTVECKDLGFLDIVPDFSSNDNIIQQLEIKGRTAFDTIQPRAFGNLKIRNLKLTGLSIINLTSCSFCGLGTHLESLYLDENGLSSLPNDIFHELVGLIYLHLDQNALTYINASHFDSLVNLQHLDLQGNLLSDIPGDSFRNLQSLVSLYLDNNNIEHINPGLFQNMPSLKILYLGPNAINNLSSTPFQPLQSMERLILRRNKITTIPETLLLYNNKLTHLELDYNNISVIPIGLFSSTANMEYIDMKFNKITSFHSTTFSNLVFLKYLFLRNNLLNTIPLNAFENLNKLQTLDLQNNNIQDLAYHNLIGLSNLKELYLQGNQLLVIPYGIFDPVTKLQILDLSKNKLQYAFHGPFDTLRNLERLHLSHNQLVSITKDWFQNLDRIKQLLLTNNKIREVEIGTFENLNFLLELDISDNHLLKVEDNLFNNLSNLDKLKLARNPLSNLTAKSFIGLRKLRELHLNNTCIGESVNSDSLKDMPNLEVLHMRHNDLILISSSLFQHQHSLKSLDIYNCKLNSIQHWESATSLQSLQIGENPLNCSCENAWLRQMYGISSDVLKLTCQDDHMGYYTVCFPQTNCTQFWNQTFQTLCSLNASTDDTVLDTTPEYVVEDICDPNRYVDTVTKSPGRTAPTQKILEEIVVYNLSVAQNYSYVSISWSVTDEYKNYISKFIIHLEFNDSSRMIDVQNPYHYIPVSELTMDVNYTVCLSVTLSSGRLLPFLSCKNVHMIQKTTTVYMSTVTANIISSTPSVEKEFPLIMTIAVSVAGGIILIAVFCIIIYCCCVVRNRKSTEKEEIVYPEHVFKVGSLTRNGEIASEQLVEHSTLTWHPREDAEEKQNGHISS